MSNTLIDLLKYSWLKHGYIVQFGCFHLVELYLLLFAVMMNLHFQVPFFCWPKFFLPTHSNRCFWFAAKLCVMWFMARKGFQQNWKISMCTKCWQLRSDEPLSFAMHIRSSWHFSIWLRSPFYFNFIIVYISYVFFFSFIFVVFCIQCFKLHSSLQIKFGGFLYFEFCVSLGAFG